MTTRTRNPAKTAFVNAIIEVPRLTDEEREELVVSLDEASADAAEGNYRIVHPGEMHEEFEMIVRGARDQEMEELLREREERRRAS